MWKENQIVGPGTYRWADGMEYSGEWLNGKKHGQGKLTYANGHRYEGEF